MDPETHFSLTTFTELTKTACTCSTISIFLIVLFIISPLSKFFLTSVFMKIITLILLGYTMYLNNEQTNYMQNASKVKQSSQVSSQLKINIICSYVFTLFIGLLIIFVVKSFF
jgi:hypothetical protein